MKLMIVALAMLVATTVKSQMRDFRDGEKNRTPTQQAFIDRANLSFSKGDSGSLREKTANTNSTEELLAYALDNVFLTRDSELNGVCLNVMSAQKHEVFAYFKERADSKAVLSDREKSSFLKWGKYVPDPDIFRTVIDHFIDDKGVKPREDPHLVGRKLRYCDLAYMSAFARITGARAWSERGSLLQGLRISERNAKIALFKEWWKDNKSFLTWSEEKGEFYIPAEKEIGAGVIAGRNRRTIIVKKTEWMTEPEQAKKEKSE